MAKKKDGENKSKSKKRKPVELYKDSGGKDVFACPVEGCGVRAQHTTGREYESAEQAEEYIEVHIELDH